MKPEIIKNKYLHNGTSQLERLLVALSPDSFKIDERSLKDILAATYEYANQVCYFDETNNTNGNWTEFWEVETLTFLAVLSTIDIEQINGEFEALEANTLAIIETGNSTKSINEAYLKVIEHILGLANSIHEKYQKLPDDIPFKKEILTFIQRDRITDAEHLEGALETLISFHKEIYALTSDEEDENDNVLPKDKYQPFFGNVWGIKNVAEFIEIESSSDFRQEHGWDDLRRLFGAFRDALLRIQNRACYWFDQNIETPQLRQPHVALYLTFLRLFQYSRDAMNDLTRRHLEFYYREILHLKNRKAVPDDVHLLFELANNVDSLLVKEGTKLLAGKKDGKNLLFETIEEWVFNKAEIAEVKNTYLDIYGYLNEENKQIYASPDVNLAYENGEEAPNQTADSYRGFGDDVDIPDGEIGFAVASPQLILREGKRDIDVIFTLDKDINQTLIDNEFNLIRENGGNGEGNTITTAGIKDEYFKVFLSTEEGWIEVKKQESPTQFGFSIEVNAKDLILKIHLERDTPPIVQLPEDIAAENKYTTQWPIFKCYLNAENYSEDKKHEFLQLYQIFRCCSLTGICINVEADDIQENLIIQSDLGVFDGTQKFFPFGPIPEKGDHFYIGSTEVFQKALTKLEVCFDWIAPPDDFVEHYTNYVGTRENEDGLLELNPGDKLLTPTSNPPKLQIGFIDKARVDFPEAVTREGEFTGTVTGRITNLEDEPISDVQIFKNGNILTSTTNEFGEYAITGIQNTDTLVFSKEENGILQIAREKRLIGGQEIEKEGIIINNNSIINLVLFPQIQTRPNDIFTEKIKLGGIVTDIFEQKVENLSVLAQGNGFALNANISSNEYSFDKNEWKNNHEINSTNPITLQFSAPGFKTISIDNIGDWFEINIRMMYEGVLEVIEGGNEVINGKITDNVESNLAGTKIKATTALHQIITFADSSGNFTLPKLENQEFESISIEHPDFETFILQPVPNLNTLNVRLSTPKQVKRFKNKVKISGIIDGSNNNLNIVKKGLGGSIIGASDSQTYEINSDSNNKIYKDDVIEYEPNNPIDGITYHGIRIPIRGDIEFGISLPVKFQEKIDANSDANSIIFEIANNWFAGAELEFFTEDDQGNEISISPDSSQTIQDSIIQNVFTDDNATNIDVHGLKIRLGEETIFIIESSQIELGKTYTVNLYNNIRSKEENGNGQFSGRVFNGDSPNENINNAKVILRGINHQYITITSNEGEFNFPFIPEEFSEIEISKDKFNTFFLKTTDDLNVNTLNQVQINLFKENFISRSKGSENGVTFSFMDTVGELPNALVKLNNGNLRVIQSEGNLNINASDSLEFFIINNDKNLMPLSLQTQGYKNIDLSFIPYSNARVVRGIIKDVEGNIQFGVSVQSNDSVHQITTSNTLGEYAIQIPIDTNQLKFSQNGFYTIQEFVEDTNYPTYSCINTNLNFKNFNRFALLSEENKEMETCFDAKVNGLNLIRDIRTQNFERYSPTLKRGFVRLTLEEQDFFHDAYQNILVVAAIQASQQGSNQFALPNKPYTPATNNIRLCYSSKQDIFPIPDEEIDLTTIDQYFHLLPFDGHKSIKLDVEKIPFLYPFTPMDAGGGSQKTPPTAEEECKVIATANLYLGLKNLTPGSTLSLLFQTKEGTEANFDDLPPNLQWSYLAKDNQWVGFTVDRILKDTTFGLTRTGVVQLNIPYNVVRENTMLNDELYWLRIAAIEEDNANPKKTVRALPDLVKVTAQVIEARFVAEEEDPEHLVNPKPLAAETIKKLLVSNAQIKKIKQPFPSFNGRLAEEGNDFYQRISERLQHRNRAVTVWDYERLLLERFPKIYRTKCLRHTNLVSGLAPGYVMMVAIPDLQQRELEMPFQPRFSRGDLEEMATFLRTKTNFFVARNIKNDTNNPDNDNPYLRVENACYEEVKIFVDVVFKPGVDAQFFEMELNKALKKFIAPWLYDPAADISFKRRIDKSRLIQFIENQEYVENIQCCSLLHGGAQVEGVMVIPSSSQSILTSTTEHDICVIEDLAAYKATGSSIEKCTERLTNTPENQGNSQSSNGTTS